MTSELFETATSVPRLPSHRRRRAGVAIGAAVAATAILLASCGGGDDDAATSSTSSSVAVTVAPLATTPPTVASTLPPTTTTTLPELVTDGAKLIVANASGINGAAGRMTDALAVAGFSTGEATNSTEGQLPTTKVYFDAENPDAEAVANSVRIALGGGAIQVLPMDTPAPVESGEVGDASVVVAMGNDVADKSLAELQSGVAATTTTTLGG